MHCKKHYGDKEGDPNAETCGVCPACLVEMKVKILQQLNDELNVGDQWKLMNGNCCVIIEMNWRRNKSLRIQMKNGLKRWVKSTILEGAKLLRSGESHGWPLPLENINGTVDHWDTLLGEDDKGTKPIKNPRNVSNLCTE